MSLSFAKKFAYSLCKVIVQAIVQFLSPNRFASIHDRSSLDHLTESQHCNECEFSVEYHLIPQGPQDFNLQECLIL